MKNILKIAVLCVAFANLVSCKDDNKPNYQYMPNMYESGGYEAYGKYEIFPEGYEALTPAEGSIARGWMPYDYENTIKGKDSAKANLLNPLRYTEENYKKGAELYDIYCGICHGDKGDGQGTLPKREKILGIPAYNDAGRAITEGSVYHVMYYGINTMGSYASQMTEEEMWMVDHYVMSLKATLDGVEARPFVAETLEIVEEHSEGDHTEETHVEEHPEVETHSEEAPSGH